MIDLHTHSNASDGDLSPALLIQKAVSQGLHAIALTDHDTTDGLEIARNEAEKEKIRLIPGIEINIAWNKERSPEIPEIGAHGEFHLLGLGISPSPAFAAAIRELSRLRVERNREILRKMQEMGINVVWEDIQALSGGHSIGRLHFSNLLIKRKIVKNHEQAFALYLGAGKPLYVPKEGLKFEEAAALIRESGGIPVLAHPGSLFLSWSRLPDLIKALKERGLAGIEAWHPAAQTGYCKRLAELGKTLGLCITEGSDFHGSVRPERRLGYSHKNRKIDDSVLEAIPELCAT